MKRTRDETGAEMETCKRSTIVEDYKDMGKLFHPFAQASYGAPSTEEDGLEPLRQLNGLEVVDAKNEPFLVAEEENSNQDTSPLFQAPCMPSYGVHSEKRKEEDRLDLLRQFNALEDFLRQASAMFEMYVYTMGTRVYAEAMVRLLDPTRQFFGSRIISRNDNVDGNKSKSLDYILAPPSATIILDDSPIVWPKYLANLIQIDRYHFFDSSSQQFGVHFPSLLGSLKDESCSSGALARTLDLLRKVHHAFFDDIEAPSQESLVAEKDVRCILHNLRCNLLAGCKIVFIGLFPTGASSNPKAHPLWRHAEQLGAVCSTTLDDSVTHVIASDLETEMAKWAACHLDCHLVHPLWIEATYFTWKRAAESEYYTMDPTPKSSTFSKTTSLSMPQDKPCNTNSLKVPTCADGAKLSMVQCC